MFETCDWNDEGEVRTLSPATIGKEKMSSAPEKGTNSRKKRLKRNRQLLEVLHTLNTGSALHPDLTPPPGAAPPKRRKKITSDTTSTVLCPPEDAPGAQRPPEPGERLNRRQWKNKLKNKRRNRNKFKVAAAQEEPSTNQGDEKIKSQQFQGKRNGVTSEESEEEESASPPGSAARRQQVPKTKRLRAGEGRTSGDAACGQRGGDDLSPRQVTPREKARLQKLKKMMLREAKGKNLETPSEEGLHGTINDTEQPAADNSEAGRDQSVELRSRMEQRLNSARFRYINQQLYTSDSRDALHLFEQDPEAFTIYHTGFSQQVQRWPVNPITEIIKYIKNRPSSLVVADFGCGDALLARSVRNKVHSFDLVALNDRVTVCDMAKVPLQDGSVDVAIFCLSLMGKNLGDFLQEANRVLKPGGVLLVAEVSSRFGEVRQFLAAMSQLGFKSINKNTENSYFFLFEFNKTGPGRAPSRHPGLQLTPCLYKKR